MKCRLLVPPKLARFLSVLALIILTPTAGWALPWSFDMQDQPSIKAQESEVPLPPATSVPMHGREVVPITRDVVAIMQGRVASASLTNPIPPTDTAIAEGRELYMTICAVCHGDSGAGDGPVGLKFIAKPFDLTIDYVQQKPDGELFFTITNGGVVMPFYRDALSPEERWKVVHYVKRGLTQGE